jgi:hypothetical protein
MSPPKESERRAAATPNGQGALATDGQGVLSNLPRTRPQRSSPRRAAARAATAAAAAESTSASAAPASSNGRVSTSPPRTATSTARRPAGTRGSAKTRGGAGAKTRASASGQRSGSARPRPTRPAAHVEPAPRQGFECESERSSKTVQPPGGAELVASVAEIVGELTKASLSTGERLLKDVLSRLPLS